MSTNGRVQDASFLLFLVPFAASAVYALYLWAQTGLSASLPQTVFLQVTENPYVFLIGFLAVVVGATMDIRSEPFERRKQKLVQESNRLQLLAVTALVLGAFCAWYAAGFDIGTGISNLIQGRYAVIFPVMVIALSFFMLPSVMLRKESLGYIVVLLCGLASLGIVDEVGKRNYFAGIALAAALVVVAIYIYLYGLGAGGTSSASTGKGPQQLPQP